MVTGRAAAWHADHRIDTESPRVIIMDVRIFDSKEALGAAAAVRAAAVVDGAIEARRAARVIVATGASQFEFLAALARAEGVDWSRVTFFHLDEYVGLPQTHPASFRKYLRERVELPLRPGRFEYVDGSARDPEAECRRLERAVREAPIDLACVGIGENGHLAFNDPPADFETARAYQVVALDEACRRQQVGEGWFASLAEVPERAISMSIPQILDARAIICVVPDARKAAAVHACVDGPVSPMAPASALQRHANTTLFLDRDSAAQLTAVTGSLFRDTARKAVDPS
jgi:glucosamine-6-phosphate deaminase